MPEEISASTARTYWLALLQNVASLIEDAALLLEQSPARARSLLILAQEEIGKANRVYELASRAWTEGLETVELPDRFLKMERWHHPKIVASLDADEALDPFWGDYSHLDHMGEDFDLANLDKYVADLLARQNAQAKVVNLQKQAGFYVDREGEEIKAPQSIEVEDLAGMISRTAGVAEMLLITDHSRMKFETPDRYEGTNDLQMRLMPYSHPAEFFDWMDRSNGPVDVDE